jgi:ABC-type Fe3+/spermidine/putrescine transport system ATPase subunit
MLLRCIAGLENPDRGQIRLNGRMLFDSENHEQIPPRARRLGMLFQQYALFPNRTIAQKIWGMRLGRIEPNAQADLIVVDYYPPTPLHRENLFGHILFGIANAPVDSLLVRGRYVIRGKECVTVDERAVAEKAASQARALWGRF